MRYVISAIILTAISFGYAVGLAEGQHSAAAVAASASITVYGTYYMCCLDGAAGRADEVVFSDGDFSFGGGEGAYSGLSVDGGKTWVIRCMPLQEAYSP